RVVSPARPRLARWRWRSGRVSNGLRAGARPQPLGRLSASSLALRQTAMTRWFSSVARQPSLEEFEHLRAQARELFERATDERARATFLIAESFVPFWLSNLGRQPSRETLAQAEDWGRRGLELAEGLDDAVLMSAALDGIGDVTSLEYPS